MAEDHWNRSFRLVGPSDLPPEDWDMIGAFYTPKESAPSPLAQSAPARNPDPWAAFPDAPPVQAYGARNHDANPWAAFVDAPPKRYVTFSQSKSEQCVAQCLHLLPSPSGDLQGSEFSRCYRECMGRL